MSFYARYLDGQYEQVYEDIFTSGQAVFEKENFEDINKVLTETFQRSKYNLKIIYAELQKINYQFKTSFEYNFQRPLHPPLINTEKLLIKLDNAVRPFGYVPLSLKYFYRIVGGVNFTWDYNINKNFLWSMADPIQVCSLDAVVDEVTGKYWQEEIIKEEDFVSIQLAADVYHKDNISGGPSYSLEITNTPSIDGNFFNEPHETTFINYLRICFNNCGFPGLDLLDSESSYVTFIEKVQPQLKKI